MSQECITVAKVKSEKPSSQLLSRWFPCCNLAPLRLFQHQMHESSQSRRALSRGRECEDVQRRGLQSHPLTGDSIWHDGLPYWIVKINTDGSYNCRHPFRNESLEIPVAQALEGLCKLKEIEDQNLDVLRGQLPSWAFNEDAARASSFFSLCVGPTIPWLRSMAVASLAMQVAIFMLQCSSNDCSNAANPIPVWFGAALATLLVCRASIELWTLRHALPKFATACEFRALGIQVPFVTWLVCNCGLSQSNFLDMVSDSFFSAAAMRAAECHQMVEDTWREGWQQSLFCWIPAPRLRVVVAAWWLLCLLQMIITLLRTLRRSDFQLQTPHKLQRAGTGPTLFTGELVNHGTVLESLADANGMVTLQVMVVPLNGNTFANPAHSSFTKVLVCKHLADDMLERVFLSYLLENGLQLNIQSTLYAVGVAVGRSQSAKIHDQFEVILPISIGVGILMTLFKLSEVREFFKRMQQADDFAKHLDLCRESEQHNITRQRKALAVWMAGILLTLSLIYALATLVMAHICQDAVWSVAGCAIIPGIH